MAEKDWGEKARPISDSDPRGFTNAFPTETRGDGRVRPNNLRTGSGQGRGSLKMKVRCKQCGFLVDISKVDHSGGSEDGQGAGGAVTETSESGTLNNGETYTDYYGEQRLKKGSGCPFCFSKNSSIGNKTVPVPMPKTGF